MNKTPFDYAVEAYEPFRGGSDFRGVFAACKAYHAALEGEAVPVAWTNGAGQYLNTDALALNDDLLRSRFNIPLYAAPSSNADRLEGVRFGLYIASKTKHAQRWRFLRDTVGEPIISTWIDEAGDGESSDLSDLWRRCIHEASHAQVLILYREPDEVLKGGWIELGAALACGVKVYAVGIQEFTVANDARIEHMPDMKSAIGAARAYLATKSLTSPATHGDDKRGVE